MVRYVIYLPTRHNRWRVEAIMSGNTVINTSYGVLRPKEVFPVGYVQGKEIPKSVKRQARSFIADPRRFGQRSIW